MKETKQVDSYKELCLSCADQLEEAAKQRAGLMDSESKQIEIQRSIRKTIEQVVARLRS